MRLLDIWSFVAILLINTNFVSLTNLDEFIVAKTITNIPPSGSSDILVASSGTRYCAAYRNANRTQVILLHGEIDSLITRFVAIGSSDFYALSILNENCYLFYAVDNPENLQFSLRTVVNSGDATNTFDTNFSYDAPSPYTMSVVFDPNSNPSSFIVGISYRASTKLKLALYRYTLVSDINPTISEINEYIDISETSGDVKKLNMHYYSVANEFTVVAEIAGAIWAGKLTITGTKAAFFSATNTLPQSGNEVTSRVLSKTEGVICSSLNSKILCRTLNPDTVVINTGTFYSTPTIADTSKLAVLRQNNAVLLISRDDTATITARQLNTSALLSNNTLNITSIGTDVSYALADDSGSRLLAMLMRDNIAGTMQLIIIQHNFCGDYVKNDFEECDQFENCVNCTLVNGPSVIPFASPIGIMNPNAPISSNPFINTPNDSGAAPQTPSTEAPQVGVIVPAVVIPVVVVAAGLIILLVLLRRRKKRKGSLLHGKSRVEIAMESIDDRLKIPYKSLVFKKEIGAGSYGKVYVGEWKGTPVAIKVSSSVTDMDGFFDEARITVGLQQHPNVVQTFGVSLDGQLPCIVLEFCEGGSLDNRLFDSDVTMTQQQKIALIKGIARGLYHLHTNNIVHRDLAARNVLLNKSGTPKISDFGMSRVLKSEAEKGKTKTNYGPIRWMAPESLRDLQYSTKSDVWSFGIVLYEVVSRNEPHIDVDPLEVAVKIKNESYHPSVPQNVEPVLREIMLSCWQPDPNNRPSMEQICNKLNTSFPDD